MPWLISVALTEVDKLARLVVVSVLDGDRPDGRITILYDSILEQEFGKSDSTSASRICNSKLAICAPFLVNPQSARISKSSGLTVVNFFTISASLFLTTIPLCCDEPHWTLCISAKTE